MVVSTSRVPRAGNRVKKELPSELRRLTTTKRVQLIPGEAFLSHPLGVEHPSWSNWTLGWHSRNWDRGNWNEGDSSEVHPPTYLCTAFCGIGEIDLTSAASMPGRQMKVCVFVCRSLTTPPHQPPAPQGSVLTGGCLSTVILTVHPRCLPTTPHLSSRALFHRHRGRGIDDRRVRDRYEHR